MADIFISYSKQQPQPTRDVAAFLTSQGYSVWWDTNLTSGEIFRDVIDRELEAAKAVIVIWTAHSVASKWVRAEADHADRDGKLIPLRTRDLDAPRIPKPYSEYHTTVVDDRASILAAVSRVAGVPACHAAPRGEQTPAAKDARRKDEEIPLQSEEIEVEGDKPQNNPGDARIKELFSHIHQTVGNKRP
jgi:hypothetical protein